MKLTKKIEAEIRSVYQAYWDSYLSGDLKTMGSFLSDDFTLIGTSDGEVFNNKKSAMKYVKATINQVAGVLSKKNIEIKITQADDTILVNEFSDAYIKLEGTPSFYDKFRVTTVMKQVRGKWKIIHQHGSLPDSKAEVGETLATEKVKKENRELREAVKRRTRELEQKSRDLEIEASLEKVRARAMAMQSSSELADLIGMIYTELTRLDLTLDRCFIILFDEATGDATWWMASGKNSSLKRGYHAPFHKNSPHLPYLKAWRNHDSSWKHVLKGAEKKKWDEFMFSRTELAQLPKVEIKNMKAVKLIYASTAFNKYGCFTVGTLEPLASASFDLLARFSSVFEQTYTRFLDLKNAEAQARESQIQLALERVRARTMAMQHSDELQEAANLLFKQVQSLEIPVWSCGFNIWEKHEKVCTGWMSTNDTILPPFKIPLTESPIFIRSYKSRQKNEDFYVEKVEGKALAEHYKYMFSLPDFAKSRGERLKAGFSLPKSQINHVANFAHGNLVFITSEPVPDAWDIFKRFAKVFEQTYTRFLDLKKAEAQAHEAHIEAALEKVRSRSLAMHHTDELEQVVAELFNKLVDLNLTFDAALIYIFDKEKRNIRAWIASAILQVPVRIDLPFDDVMSKNQVIRDLWQATEKHEDIFNRSYSGKAKNDYILFSHKHNKSKLADATKDLMIGAKAWTVAFAAEKNSVIGFDSWSGNITSEDDFRVLKRFAKVFEQTYTRFLDLKKAEAQAREAQIEAALEKVRSSSMGMHHSDELEKVVSVLFDKLSELGLSFDGALIYNFDKEKRNLQLWVASKLLSAPVNVKLPYNDEIAKNLIIEDLWRAIEKGEHVLNKSYSGKIKDDYFLYVADNNENDVAQAVRDLQLRSESYTISFAAEKNSVVGFDSWTGQMTSDQDFQVIRRFAGVFEQAYTRFLDLQRAEAQARESQIQLALERVRARTMAMQKSEELKEVAMLLFKQVADLGITCWTTGFNVWSEDGNSYLDYVTNPRGEFMEPYTVDTSRFAVIRDVSSARKKGETFYVRLETGERQKETYSHLKELGDKDQYGKILESGFQFPSQQVNHFVFGEKVSLLFVTYDHVPEAHDIFKRFGKVFEQTYTRFLDLKNAEAQAREGQIEAALEKVRSSSLAMHHSDELEKVVTVLFDKLLDLGLSIDAAVINIFDKGKRSSQAWVATKFLSDPVKVNLPYDDEIMKNAFVEDLWRTLETGENVLNRPYSGKAKDDYFLFEARHNKSKIPEAITKFQLDAASWTVTWVTAQNSILLSDSWSGKLTSEEDFQVLKRFSRVFDQAYTRFLDLQKAEAQAREAHIESALERVRSRTMAMHKSDELLDVIAVVSEQLQHVGIKFNTVSFGKNSTSFDMEFWVAGSELKSPIKISAPYTDIPMYNRLRQAYREKTHFFSDTFTAEETKVWNQHIIDYNPELFSQKSREYLTSRPGTSRTAVLLKNVFLFLINHDFVTYSNEDIEIVIRFANVFEQTYTRFLDLQKAEMQAREAQIQLALERIRARTMAMHQSIEVRDVAVTISDQLHQLGFGNGWCSVVLIDGKSGDMEWWMGGSDERRFQDSYFIRNFNHPAHRGMVDGFIKNEKFRSFQLSGESKRTYDDGLFINNGFENVPDKAKDWMRSLESAEFSVAYNKHGALHSGVEKLTDEQADILHRFANVFEQTYTRFLDLQNAEAQAREAQIEAALERLRGRTMAMQHSTELAEVAELLYQQFLSLGVQTMTCAFMFPDEEKKTQSGWTVLPDGTLLPQLLDFPLIGDDVLEERYVSWKEKKSLHRRTIEGEENKKHHQFLSEKVAGHISKDIFSQLPNQLTFTNANFAQGYLFLITTTQLLAEEENILARFAKVFEQTYTRFLDLQKAEAQAREAQIESALEKIRSRSLAMHHSGELKDVVAIMFEKMKELNVVIGTIAIQLFDQTSMSSTFWAGNNLHDEPPKVKLPYYEKMLEEDGYMKDSWDCKKKGENIINKEYTFEQKTRFFDHVFASNDLATIPEAGRDVIRQSVISPPNGLIVCLINEKNSSVYADSWNGEFYSDESIKVLIRAAKVFEQAYVRFLDLQKAEAQARESQIEAALERVRAKTMAMHKSEELLDVIVVVSQQLSHLDFRFDVVSFARNSEMHDYRFWFCMEKAQQAYEIQVPYLNSPMFDRIKSAMAQGAKFYADTLTVAENREWIEHMLAHDAWPGLTDEVKNFLLTRGYARSIVFMPQIMLLLGNYFLKPYSEEQNNILKRFAAVFEQSYTRFLDLQKAEAQAREAQIEAALERVRAKAMAMHTAQQLSEVVHELRTQMGLLGQKDLNTCVIHLNDESPDFVRRWAAIRRPDTNDEISEFSIEVPKQGLTIIEDALKAYAASQQDYVLIAEGEKAKQWMEFGKMALPEAFALTKGPSYDFSVQSYWSFSDFQGGSLIMITYETPDENSRALLRRFANVFGLAYRRFADLKQAEDQAREAQIEAALERVRSRAMAMHTAQQLTEVVHELRKQMGSLGQKDLETCVIHLNDESPDFIEAWAASRLPNRSDEIQEFHVMIPKRGLKIIEESMEAYSANRKDYVMINDGARLDEWIEFMRESVPGAHALVIESVNSSSQEIKRRAYWSFADFQGGSMLMVTLAEPNETSRALLRRFSNVFGLAYRRFADLKQAEAQAREATIETALEKIRSRSLGMHKSEEILDVVAILFGKLKELGLVFDGGAAIHLFSEGSRDATIWVMSPELSRPIVSNLPYDEVVANNPIILDVWKARDTGQHIVNKHYSFEEKKAYFEYVFKHNADVLSEEVKDFIRSANSYTANFIAEKNSLLGASSWTGQVFSENDIEVLKRVARVFEQAYIRFLDLQKAEAQAKEATIEAALEKIRSRSLGMHQSDELKDVVSILFEKLKELDLPFDGGAGLFLFPEGSRDTYLWVTNGHVPPVCNYLPYDEHDFSDNPVMQDVWKAKNTGEPLVSKHYSSEEKNKLFSYTSEHNDETKIPEEERKRVFEANSYTATFIPEKNSLLSVDSWTKQIMSAGDLEILKRFTRVFEQAYVRFLDLQKAEVHAKEAVCQASLDRVRAEIASMRTVEDLDRITPLIWRELNTIGIPFIRCGVFITDETNRIVHTFLSTPEGKAIAVFHLPFDASGFVGNVVKHWQDKSVYVDYWDDIKKNDFAETLVKRGIFASKQQYLDILPREGFHLHFLPFTQGMLYVANLTKLKDEELTLLQSLADSFATAYARYDDFNKLESAKQQVDRTLVDLKQAQQQLVHSEKMASLGELTAGIAHEIQNPLNFVNNFSEVSNELIDEMKTELIAGNLKEAAELAESIRQNLEKINHHGKRADGIVKGMLQHSRAGSGQKEPIDINFLCDEYLRLAYHGYRAKEKSFNAKFESSFDPTLPKVNVVGQDIGRVILNLINNAFYAVTEMKRQKADSYEPIVSVITKNMSGKVEIRVKDNGIGISEKVLEKIFQPFFTTKPTGQGTGLGLSLSYDIIKAHGGALEVSSKQGEGSEFIIQLPT